MISHIHMPAFYLGMSDGLFNGKSGDSLSGQGNINGSILPKLDSQAKWKYAKGKDFLRLSDGRLTFNFGLPTELPAADTIVKKLGDTPLINFEHDATEKGTAQVHSSEPDRVHVTLADGKLNPTFKLEHHEDQDWKYVPSKKFVEKLEKAVGDEKPIGVDMDSLLEGGRHEMKKKAYIDLAMATGGAAAMGTAAQALLAWKALHPAAAATAAATLGLGVPKLITGKTPSFTKGVGLPVAGSLVAGGLAHAMQG